MSFQSPVRYTVYNPHTIRTADGLWKDGTSVTPESDVVWVQVAAIDPGVKNCALRVERREWPPGTPAAAVHSIPPTAVTTVVQARFCFSTGRQEAGEIGGDGNAGIHHSATEVISGLADILASCHFVLIETQLKANPAAMKLAQTLISAVCAAMRDSGVFGVVVEVDAKLKSHPSFYRPSTTSPGATSPHPVMGPEADAPPPAPPPSATPAVARGAPRMQKASLKRWAVAKALEYLAGVGDTETEKFIRAAKKRDDHGDVVLYTYCWFDVLKRTHSVRPAHNPVRPAHNPSLADDAPSST